MNRQDASESRSCPTKGPDRLARPRRSILNDLQGDSHQCPNSVSWLTLTRQHRFQSMETGLQDVAESRGGRQNGENRAGVALSSPAAADPNGRRLYRFPRQSPTICSASAKNSQRDARVPAGCLAAAAKVTAADARRPRIPASPRVATRPAVPPSGWNARDGGGCQRLPLPQWIFPPYRLGCLWHPHPLCLCARAGVASAMATIAAITNFILLSYAGPF